jgi:4-hydroxybenzoate polyprenyltransferase
MAEKPARFMTFRFWQAYLVTMRPYLLFISGAAGLVGMAFIPEPVAWRLVLGFVPLFLAYGLGQALTDCFQTDTDAISSPYRPLVSGVLTRGPVLTVSLTGLILGVVIIGWLNPQALIPAALSVIGLLSYTFFKRRWWGGPPWNSWIVALLPLMGRLIDRSYRFASILPARDDGARAFLLAVGAVFFGYANFVVMGYFKDISADRATGYRTFPVVFGWVPAAIYSDVTALGAAGLSFTVLLWLGLKPVALVVFLAGFVINLLAQVGIHRTRDEHASHGPIANVVRALVLYCLALVLELKPGWLILVVAFYAAFELVLRLRPERTQV